MNDTPQYGFIGLGDMGKPMATHIAAAGFPLYVYDAAGTRERAPLQATACDSADLVAAQCDTVFVCVPDGDASLAVINELAAGNSRRTTVVIDLSTTGVGASRHNDRAAKHAGMDYVDCPVSGGRAGAAAGTITIIFAGPGHILGGHRNVLASFSGNIFHVGESAGQGQAMKLLNNFLSATAMAATSEAIAFGLAEGLDMKTMLDVLNVSTGQNTATKDKFVNRVLTGSYDAGFRTRLMRKDVALYKRATDDARTVNQIAALIDRLWTELEKERPDSDFTEVFKHIKNAAPPAR